MSHFADKRYGRTFFVRTFLFWENKCLSWINAPIKAWKYNKHPWSSFRKIQYTPKDMKKDSIYKCSQLSPAWWLPYLCKFEIQLHLFFQVLKGVTQMRLLVTPSVTEPPKLIGIPQQLLVALILLFMPMHVVFPRKTKVEMKIRNSFSKFLLRNDQCLKMTPHILKLQR